MLRLIRISCPLSVLSGSFPARQAIGVSIQNRVFSSKPLYSPNKSKFHMKKEETAVLDRLLLLVETRTFDKLFESLKDTPCLNARIFSRVIQAKFAGVSIIKEVELKENILKIMRERGVIPTAYAISPLITLYKRVKSSRKADDLLDMMKEKGIKRNPVIYNSLMNCHANDKARVADLYSLMIKDDIKPDVYTYNSMIETYAKNGEPEKAYEMFALMKKEGILPDVVIYTTMIYAYAKNGDMDNAVKMFASMKDDGIKADVVAYNTMIDTYVKNGDLEMAVDKFATMKKNGIEPNVVTYCSMIDAYSKNGDLEKAVDMFALMKSDGIKPNVVTYTTMIDSYAKNGEPEKAYQMFALMMNNGIAPDVFIYTTMIDAYVKNGDLEKAVEMFALMKIDGIKPDIIAFGAMLNGYAKSGKHVGEMMGILKEMKECFIIPDVKIWTNILEGFTRSVDECNGKKALSIWKYLSGQQTYESLEMGDLPVKESSIYPSSATFSVALDACKLGRFEEEAHSVWMYGQENERIALESNVLTSYVEALATFGEKGADRAIGLIQLGIKGEKMPLRCVKPDEKTIENAKWCLVSNGWTEHAAKLEGIVV